MYWSLEVFSFTWCCLLSICFSHFNCFTNLTGSYVLNECGWPVILFDYLIILLSVWCVRLLVVKVLDFLHIILLIGTGCDYERKQNFFIE